MDRNQYSPAALIAALRQFRDGLPAPDKARMKANLKANWYFPVSALAFFCVSATLDLGYLLGLLIAVPSSAFLASQSRSFRSYARQQPLPVRLLSALSAAGVCLAAQRSFYTNWTVSPKTQALASFLPVDLGAVLSFAGAAAGIVFVYLCLLFFWQSFWQLIRQNRLFRDFTRKELVFYALLLLLFLGSMTAVFLHTDAFYGTDLEYDIIYTSDSPSLVRSNAYLTLTHPENDLRQPLFSLFSAPFLGLPYLLGRLLGGGTCQALLMNSVQLVLLFAANLLLAGLLDLSPPERCCFTVLLSCCYFTLLFSLMMEQYIVAYFWLILCICLAVRGRPSTLAFLGAGGTLLTSLAVLPFLSDQHPVRAFPRWLWDVLRLCLSYAAVLLVFCRFDVIFGVVSRLVFLSNFGGASLSLYQKLCQYTAFVSGCFAAPAGGVNTTAVDHISWQLHPVAQLHIPGLILLGLMLLSIFVNRKNLLTRFAAMWMALSVVMLVILGWGTGENGLILYGLYFGWAYLVLLVQLADCIGRKLRLRFLVGAACLAAGAVLAWINLPALGELIRFAVTYYGI